MDMDNSVGIDSGSGWWAVWRRTMGEKLGHCNKIKQTNKSNLKNKIELKIENKLFH